MAIKMLLYFIAVTTFVSLTTAKIDPNNLKCLVCRKAIDELEMIINDVDPKKNAEVGNYRLDGSGNIIQDKVPLSKSQVFISEAVDDICKKMEDYVRVKYKATQKLNIMKMMAPNGSMNPDLSKTDFVTDEDLNKSLEFYCEEILGENEDYIVDIYSKRGAKMPNGKDKVCKDHLNICEDWMMPNEEDLDWSAEKESLRSKSGGGDPYGFGGMGGMQMPPSDFNYNEEDAGELEMNSERVEL